MGNKDTNINWTKWGTIFGGFALLATLASLYFSSLTANDKVVPQDQSGGITAGGVTNNYYQASSYKTTGSNNLQIPVFSLAKDYDNSSRTEIENKELFKKYIGLTAENQGYVRNVYSDEFDNTVSVSLTENLDDSILSGLFCKFDSNWTKTVASLRIGQVIKFSGEIGPYSAKLRLYKCQLKY